LELLLRLLYARKIELILRAAAEVDLLRTFLNIVEEKYRPRDE
jgi:hypothetical protein